MVKIFPHLRTCTATIAPIIYLSPFRVVIRGDPNEEAVLCTEDKTFELRSADTSNALLIAPSLALHSDPGTEFCLNIVHLKSCVYQI